MTSDEQSLYKAAFEKMFSAFAHCQAVYDEAGNCVDFIYLMVNPAFERHTGLTNVIGRRVTELVPNILTSNPEVFKIYERVSKGGSPESVERFTSEMGMWFNLLVFSTEPGTFSAIFENVSGRRKLTARLEESNEELLAAYDDTLMCLVRALQFRDRETDGHSERVTAMSTQFASKLGIRGHDLIQFRRGALLHDIGKMFIPDSILRKRGRLTEEEIAVMRRHPQLAHDLLVPVKFLKECVIDIPYCHHEKWDGSGYPNGLANVGIPLCARIFSVVDVFDAMTSDRVYRPALSRDFALTYISEQGGKAFDPRVASHFINFVEKQKAEN